MFPYTTEGPLWVQPALQRGYMEGQFKKVVCVLFLGMTVSATTQARGRGLVNIKLTVNVG